VLTPEQETALFRRYKSGDETALIQIVQHNLRFVVSVAKQYENHGLWLGDLINEGNIGVMTAVRKFDETRGFKFISYAVWWIRQSIIAAIANNGRKIRLPANYNNISIKIRRFQAKFTQEEGRDPNVDELMFGTGFTKTLIEEHFRVYPGCNSLDAPLKEEEVTTLIDAIADQSIAQPDHELAAIESRKLEIKALLNTLPGREASIIVLSFGLDAKFPLSMEDIGIQLGISGERVRQIRDKSLRKLRRQLKARPLEE
jgi:RNA polymerase primary sigma factor